MRAVCEVLALDTAVEEEVAALRSSALRLTHTREFAPEAAFRVRVRAAAAVTLPLCWPQTLWVKAG